MSEYTGDGRRTRLSWALTLRLAWRRLRRAARRSRRNSNRRWSIVTILVLFVAGGLFATSGLAAGGTSFRNDQDVALRELIPERNDEVGSLAEDAERLRGEVDARDAELGDDDGAIAAERDRATEQLDAAGLTAVHGPALSVTLNDAPRRDGQLPTGATVDDVVVHQQDVQAVVNALWHGGAEAMTIMNIRVISTSAVRCVGNTLLLHGRVYSPPFIITAIGDQREMADALDSAPGVQAFRAAADDFGLGYSTEQIADVEMPGYDGPVDLVSAEVPQ